MNQISEPGAPAAWRNIMIRVAYADGEVEEWPIAANVLRQRKAARPRLQTSEYNFRRLRAKPFWNPTEVGCTISRFCSQLEASFDAIEREALVLLKPLLGDDGNGSGDEEESTGAGGSGVKWTAQGEGLHSGIWLRLELWSRGLRQDRNCAALPTLAALLDDAPAVMRDPPGRCYLSLMLAGSGPA